MTLTVDVRDAARVDAGEAWDALVAAADLPALWHAGPITAYARASREAVFTARVDDDGEPVALTCFRGRTIGPARRYRDLRAPPRPVALCCRPPVACLPGFAFAPTVPMGDRRRLLTAAERATRARVGPWCRAVTYEWVGPNDRTLFTGARVAVRLAPVALLSIAWPTIDGYLAQLPARRRRRFAALLDSTGDVKAVPFDMAPTIDAVEASRLELSTRLRHLPPRAGATPLPAAYFDAVLATGRAGTFGFRRPEGGLLQFDLAFPTADRLTATATGSEDRSIASDLYTAVFLREVAWAASHGLAVVDVGPGSLDEKRRFGCVTEERWAFLRP